MSKQQSEKLKKLKFQSLDCFYGILLCVYLGVAGSDDDDTWRDVVRWIMVRKPYGVCFNGKLANVLTFFSVYFTGIAIGC